MRLAPLLALPPIALGIVAAVWMITSAPGPERVEGGPPALPVRVMTVTPQDIRPSVAVWGNLRAAEHWVAVAEVQGEVIWRHPDMEPGRMIAGGTEVLRIDPADYELALAQAEADLASFVAEGAQLTAEATNTARILEIERQRLALAEAELARTRALADQGTVARASADEAARATLLAHRTVAELENALELIPARQARIVAQTARTMAALDRAHRLLARTKLSTPFDLRITEVNAERFQTVAPGQVVIRADGISSIEVVAHLPLEAFRRLIGAVPAGIPFAEMMREGPGALISVTLSPLSDPTQEWPARVSRIEGALDARARTVPVVVSVAAPYAGADPPRRLPLVPNMQVLMSFSGATLADVLIIPEAALHAGFVRIVGADNRLELRAVTANFTQDGRVVLTDGLAPGDRVVLDDIAPAIPGQALHPVAVAAEVVE